MNRKPLANPCESTLNYFVSHRNTQTGLTKNQE